MTSFRQSFTARAPWVSAAAHCSDSGTSPFLDTHAMKRRHFLHAAGAAACALSPMASLRAQTGESPAASLSGRLLDGRPYELRQDLGKVVLVFFWATSCSVCRDKMPEVRANFQAWRDKPFQLLAVSTDKSLAELRGYESILNRVVQPGQPYHSSNWD